MTEDKITRNYKDRSMRELADLLQREADRICTEWGIKSAFVYINSRMNGNCAGKYRHYESIYGGEWYTGLIQISYGTHLVHGVENTLKVLYHELAHHITGDGHTNRFFSVCAKLGGSVGPQFANRGCEVTTNFLPRRERTALAVYRCQCGSTIKIKTRKVLDTLYRRVCRRCRRKSDTFEKIS